MHLCATLDDDEQSHSPDWIRHGKTLSDAASRLSFVADFASLLRIINSICLGIPSLKILSISKEALAFLRRFKLVSSVLSQVYTLPAIVLGIMTLFMDALMEQAILISCQHT